MKKLYCAATAAALIVLAGSLSEAKAQSEQENITAAILAADDRFWQAYNQCDTASFREFFTPDVEFYHDKGGMTMGSDALTESLTTGLCGNGVQLRREAIDETVHVFPLRAENVVYGAVLSGEHRFYVLEEGKPARLDGQAKFMDLWRLEEGAWKMSRVLSYDHGPVAFVNTRQAIPLSESVLDALVGPYRAPQTGLVHIRRNRGRLLLSTGDGAMEPLTLHPENDHVFFVKERDLTFEFVKNELGEVVLMRVRENGEIVEEAAAGK